MNLISLLKDGRLTLGEVEFLETILDKDQEILWSGRPRRPIARSLALLVCIWALVSAGYVWRDIQGDQSIIPGIAISAISLVLVLLCIGISLRLNSLKPNIIVTRDAVVHTTAHLQNLRSVEMAIASAIAEQSLIKRAAFVAQLNADTDVRVTKNKKIGSLIIGPVGASTSSKKLKPLKLSHVPDPEGLGQIIISAIAERKNLQERTNK